MQLSRGLAALILLFFFSFSASADFLYRDDVVHNPKFAEQINAIGTELKAKTGISLYLVMIHDDNRSISDIEKEIASTVGEPSVILTFVETQREVDILARPVSVYNSFDKAQVLSPNATWIASVVSSVMFAHSYDQAKELMNHYGGTILPILAERTKGDDTVKKYSVAMYNGYTDIADQIAAHHGVSLSSSAGNESTILLDLLRILFYGIIVYALLRYAWAYYKKRSSHG